MDISPPALAVAPSKREAQRIAREILNQVDEQAQRRMLLVTVQNFSGPDDLVFASAKSAPLNGNNLLRRVIKPIAVKLGMPWLSWRVFGHTHSTLGEQIGMALSDRQAQMGHGDVLMTMPNDTNIGEALL